ncbi:O-antigen ligase family protein [bacterium]|nr:O-antigen ligase family protein [bacterium]MBU1957247.1 O-antigen ligase family protein [bacterium]
MGSLNSLKKNTNKNFTFLKLKEHHLVLILIYISFFMDSLNAILMKIEGTSNSISLVTRIIVEVVFLFLLFKNRIIKPIYILIGFISIASLGMLIVLPENIINSKDFFQNIITINKILYFFIVLNIVFFYFKDKRKVLFNFFEIAYTIFIISIFLGFIFHIPFFEAYPQDARFGYKGFIVTTNETVGIFIIGLFYYMAKYDQYRNKKYIISIFFILIAGLLTGSKANLFFLLLSFLFLYGYFLFHSKKISYSLFVLIPIGFLIDWEKIINIFEKTITYTRSFYDRGYDIWFVLLSGRNLRVEKMFNSIQELPYNLYHYLFGGFNFSAMGTEMDLFDIFQLFGIIGGLIFYYLYFKSMIQYSKKYKFIYPFIFIWFIVSTLGGHLIYNAVIPIYLSIMLLKFHDVRNIKNA